MEQKLILILLYMSIESQIYPAYIIQLNKLNRELQTFRFWVKIWLIPVFAGYVYLGSLPMTISCRHDQREAK